jgi:hypothetical protein
LSNQNEIRIIKGSLRYAGANDVSSALPVTLQNTQKEFTEYDRNLLVDLDSLFDSDRQRANKFVPTCKLTFIFQNAYSGFTAGSKFAPYKPINHNLYYVNPEQSRIEQSSQQNPDNEIAWAGFPQYDEFCFIRTDSNVSGYTVNAPNEPAHILFDPKEASFYNWFVYLSYPYLNDYEQQLEYVQPNGELFSWIVGDGIPFYITNGEINGHPVIYFNCPYPHGLSADDSIELSFSCNTQNIFDVYTLGNEFAGSVETIFTISNIGFTCGLFGDGANGTFKRIINKANPEESKSKYYIRKHLIVSDYNDAILTNAGFENNGFRKKTKYESSSLTPNFRPRVSVKESNQTYNLSFKNDFSVSQLRDNLKRPLTELYITIVNRGRFGWFNELRQGWHFNIGPNVNTWWTENPNSYFDISRELFIKPGPIINNNGNNVQLPIYFYYNNPLNINDSINGPLCEWNNITQEEVVISEYYHKIRFNQKIFNTGVNYNRGYYYNPHYKLQLRSFSSYVEESDGQVIDNLPYYSYYSNLNQEFIWRDIYPYGFIDNDGVGVDNPFLNNKHYLFENFIFRLIPEGSNVDQTFTQVNDPTIDDCE